MIENISGKDIIVFDLDGTLAVSKSPIDSEMADLVAKLLDEKKMVIVSGGAFPQFESQFISGFSAGANLENLIIMPTSGTEMRVWKQGSWQVEYSERLNPEEKRKIINAMNSSLDEVGLSDPDLVYGPPIIEDRGSQITFSALGQHAPVEAKRDWDESGEKKKRIAESLSPKIPEFSVGIGGMTSIDVTRKGVNKAYAIKKLEDYFKTSIDKIVFVGDALFEGGNDYPARSTGVECISVANPEETKKLIKSWVG